MPIDRLLASLRSVLSVGTILVVVVGFALFCALAAFRLAGYADWLDPWGVIDAMIPP